jgi:hypothetical protein
MPSPFAWVALAAALLWSCSKSGNDVPTGGAALSDVEASSVATPVVPAAVRPVPVPALQVRYTSSLWLGGQQLVARLSGVLARSEPWEQAGRHFRTYQLHECEAHVGAPGQKPQSVRGLEAPFLLSEGTGEPLIGLDLQATTGAQQLLLGLAGLLQATPPPETEAETWSTEEWDATGTYDARYTRADEGWVERQKLRYRDDALEVDRSSARLRLGTRGEVLDLNLSEALRSRQLGMRFETRLVLAPHDDGGAIGEAFLGSVPEGYSVLPLAEAARKANVVDAAPDQAFEPALQALLESDHKAFDAPTHLAVLKWLDRHPEDIGRVALALERHPDRAGALTSLLAGMKTPEAARLTHRVLLEEGWPRAVREELLLAILLQGLPSEELLRVLRQLADTPDEEIAGAAINAEGMLLKRARESERLDVKSQVQDYLERAEACSERPRCSSYLFGAGYVGSDAALAVLRRKLGQGPPYQRIAAIRALEDPTDPRVDGWLLGRLREESDARVKGRALTACMNRGSSACARGIEARYRATKSAGDRRDLLTALASGRFPPAELVAALQRAARAERDPSVRAHAERLLAKAEMPVGAPVVSAPSPGSGARAQAGHP